MGIGSVLIIAVIAILTAGMISRPLWEGSTGRKTAVKEDPERSSLLSEKERILSAIRELDFDHTEGKITDEDFTAQRAILIRHGGKILQDLETGEKTPEKVESALPAHLPVESGQPQGGDEIEEMIAAYRGKIKAKAVGFCPHCGKPVRQDDFYCPRCGTKL